MPTHQAPREKGSHGGRGRWIAGLAALVICLVVAGVVAAPRFVERGRAAGAGSAAPAPPHQALVLRSGGGELKAAIYSAVIPGLMPYTGDAATITSAYRVDEDTVVYGSDRATPVAFIPRLDFLGNASVVVPVSVDGEWTEVLTPARVQLPSAAQGNAPAQSAGWVKTAALGHPATLEHRIEVSVSKQRLSIIPLDGNSEPASYPVGVGQQDAQTPLGTGYLQERYLDPGQDERVYPIQLTSLHSSALDEPYDGSDGGLIGIHFSAVSSGAVSHGCIRLGAAAIASVNLLPLGTPVTITP